MNKKSYALGVLACAWIFSGCAKDMTQDEWQRQNNAAQFQKIQSNAGVYTGKMETSDHSKSSDIVFELKAVQAPSASGSASASTSVPSLQGTITILGAEMASVSFAQGAIDPDTYNFTAVASVTDRSGAVSNIDISGNVSGGSLTGTIENRNYTETRQTFALNKSSAANEAAAVAQISHTQYGRTASSSTQYNGTVLDPLKKVPLAANVLILLPAAKADQLFLEAFSPIKIVEATMNISVSADYSTNLYFALSQLDERRGLIYGLRQTQTGAVLNGVYLSCQQATKGWDCSYFASGSSTAIYTGHFE